MKKNTGVTMVSLVVTIIVLIILAGISISTLIGDNGVIKKAQQARENIELAQIDEQTSLNQLYEEMQQEQIYEEDAESNKKDEMIKSLQEQMEELKRKLSVYKLGEGDYIKYDTEIEGIGVITCRVLYTASSKYGLQIISDKNIESVALGGNTFEEGRTSYNNAIQTLNNEAEKYINAKYATDARCVGSVPTVENGVFSNKNSETAGPTILQFAYNGSTSIDCKETDMNYVADQTQMQNFRLCTTGQNYWLASRNVYSSSSDGTFNVRHIDTGGTLQANYLCGVNYNNYNAGNPAENGLRPCFLLKSDIQITGGDGKTEATAYTIE